MSNFYLYLRVQNFAKLIILPYYFLFTLFMGLTSDGGVNLSKL